MELKVGASLMGFLGGKIEAYYGKEVMTYLRAKYKVTISSDKGDAGPKAKAAKPVRGRGGSGRGRGRGVAVPEHKEGNPGKLIHRQKWKPNDLTSNKAIYRDGWKHLGLQPVCFSFSPRF